MLVPGCRSEPEPLDEPVLPVVLTLETTGISANAAVSGGKIVVAGSAAVTSRGVCWNRDGNPTVTDSRTIDGNGTGTFTSIMEGLGEATSYFVRAYAISEVGIAYGGQEYFTTNTIPTVETADVTDITSTGAITGGKVVFCGGASVSVRGVCWGTAENPTVAGQKTKDGKNTGSFRSALTGLLPGNVYYVRAYATNSVGTGYGNQLRFTTR